MWVQYKERWTHVFPLLKESVFLLYPRDNFFNFIMNVDVDAVAAPSHCQSDVHVCWGWNDMHCVLEKQTLLLCSWCADVQFLPISGLFSYNMKERVSKDMCPWWNGPCLFEALDDVKIPERSPKGPFRFLKCYLTFYRIKSFTFMKFCKCHDSRIGQNYVSQIYCLVCWPTWCLCAGCHW